MVTSEIKILDADIVCEILGVKYAHDIMEAATRRAKSRYPGTHDADARDAGLLVHVLANLGGDPLAYKVRQRWLSAHRVVECLMGFDPKKGAGLGYEPPIPPLQFADNPRGFVAMAVDRAIDLLLHPAGLAAVAGRIARDVITWTRNRTSRVIAERATGPDGEPGKRKLRVYEAEWARAARILDVFASDVPSWEA